MPPRPLIRSVGPGMALLGLRLLAIGLLELESNPVPVHKSNSPARIPGESKLQNTDGA